MTAVLVRYIRGRMKESGATAVIAIRMMQIIRHIAVSVTDSLPVLYHKSKTRFRNFTRH